MLPILILGIGAWINCTGEPSEPTRHEAVVQVRATDPELCAEHGVLEAVCTKCNPSLSAVFQAKGDWCDEHGFPESFCPICAPERQGRPAVDVSPDGSPADGTVVRFKSPEAASMAGIETALAEETPWVEGTEVVARIVWDATRVARVSPRATGVVTAIAADVGMPVDEGASLAQIRSAQVGGDRSRAAAARESLDLAIIERDRERDLMAAGASSLHESQEANRAVAEAEGRLGALLAETRIVGGGRGDSYEVTAPLAGVVTERFASIGQVVGPDAPLFEVVDPSRMWAELDVPQNDLASVAVGQPVRITLSALPDRVFDGTLAYLAPSVDPHTRTAKARVVLTNDDGSLRANLYGSATIVTGTAASVVVVPSAAVQHAGDIDLVFVRQSADTFVARRVRVLARTGDQVRVGGPLQPGDPVATTGSFLLKTETLKDSIGAGCCDLGD
jgi:membrane fusion protein, heavy metal efflux system